ncbi:MAG: BACON domain-containing carbohydrate-binding protein [Desulfobacteraceae bacterium]
MLTGCGGGSGDGGSVGAGGGTGSGLELNTSSISFTASQNGSAPAPQSVVATITASDAYYILAGYPPGAIEASWLDIELYGSDSNWTFEFQISDTSLPEGMYSATIRILCARSDETVIAYRDLAVYYTIDNSLNVTPLELVFNHIDGSSTLPADQTVQVNGYLRNWTAQTDRTWVQLDNTSGVTPSNLSLGVDPSGLSAGIHTATVTITDGVDTFDVDVTLELETPVFQLGATSLTFNGVNGAEIAPQPLTVALNNGGSVAWTAVSSDTWLVLDKSSGTTPDVVTVSVDPAAASLSSGSYSGTITIEGSYYGDPLSAVIPVQFYLNTPSISINPGNILLGGDDGIDLNPQSLLQFSLPTGANAYPWTATLNTNSGGFWLLADTTSGTVSSSPVDINLSIDRSLLSGGVYDGSVTLRAAVNGDTVTTDVPVTLNVEHHHLFVADNGVAFTSTPTLSKLSHNVEVQDSYGLTTTAWSATSNQSWLTVTNSGFTGDDLTITVDPTDMDEDTAHFATVTIRSSAGTIENTETVRVGFWIGSTAVSDTTSVAVQYQELISDPIRPYAYVHNMGSDISVYNIYTGGVVTTISNVAQQLGPMVTSSDGSYLYAADLDSYQIVVLNLDSLTVEDTWALASSPTNMHLAYTRPGNYPVVLASDGKAYDANDGTLFNADFIANSLIAASLDGTTLFVREPGVTYQSLNRYTTAYSALEEDGLIIQQTATLSEYGDGRDLAVSADGLRVYTASPSPYNFRQYNGDTLSLDQTLVASFYPNNAEVGPNGLFYGAISSWYGPTDVWIYDDAGDNLKEHYLSGYADEILDRQLAVSGDGLRIMVLTTDPTLQFVTGQ